MFRRIPLPLNWRWIKNNEYTNDELDQINSFFPQAVIFDSKLNVVRYPLKSFNENKRKR